MQLRASVQASATERLNERVCDIFCSLPGHPETTSPLSILHLKSNFHLKRFYSMLSDVFYTIKFGQVIVKNENFNGITYKFGNKKNRNELSSSRNFSSDSSQFLYLGYFFLIRFF